MNEIRYIIKDVDFSTGIVEVDFTLKDESVETAYIEIQSIAISDEDTELQLQNTISEIVYNHFIQFYPPPLPKPKAILGMKGKHYTVSLKP